jgi:fumarate reductase flavoprotein subunit
MSEIDVVVAGAGAAGMMAALVAASRGARVALLERDAGARNTLAASGGLFAAAGTRWQAALGIDDSPALFASDIAAKTGDAVDPRLRAAVSTHAARAATFLADGAGLPVHLHRGQWPGHSAERLHATPAESGAELHALLRAAVAPMLRDGAALEALLPGGVEISEAGTRRRLAARAVVLATGGFGADPALRARFIPGAARAVHVGGALADGTGIRLAEQAGAALACMDAYQGQPHVSPHLIAGERPRFGAALPAHGAVLVNRLGQRFADERMGPSELTAHLLAQPEGVAVEIWAEAAQQAALAGGPFRRAVELGAVARCGSLAELAARFALPEGALAATLAGWAPPFFAAEVTGALAHTQGGVVVDGAARVLRGDGTPIPGLFAAGGVACGISGLGSAGYVPGNGLAQSFALGLLAGESAAL